MLRKIDLASIAVLFAGTGLAQQRDVDLAEESLVKARLERGLVRGPERQATIRELFRDAGCEAEEQPVDKHSGNVICTLPGQSDSTIVVGGHFDFVDRGRGIVDDWSGTSLLPSLYHALKIRQRQHTYVFVAFAAEERGLVGSTKNVKALSPAQKARIRGFVNLECLGVNPVKLWISRSTPELVARLDQVARARDMAIQGVNIDRFGDDDTHPFLTARIPVISIHSLTQDKLLLLHGPRDRLDAIHFDEYYATYRLVAYYLAYLDVKTE